MGQSVSADLAYGVDVGWEESIWADEEMQETVTDGGDIMEGVMIAEGLKSPWDQVPDEVNRGPEKVYQEWKAEHPEFEKALEKFYADKKVLEEACPLDIGWYGSLYDSGSSSYVIYVKGFEVGGSWEGTTPITPEKLVVPDQETLDACAAYAEKYGLKWGEPAWLLYGSLG